MGLAFSFGSGYQFGTVPQLPSYPQYDWIADGDTALTLKAEAYERTAGIGKGKFGLVFLAQHKPTSKFVAIKFISKQAIFDSQKLEKFQQEITVLQTVRHPFLMECFGGFDTPTCIAIICEFAYGGELFNRLKKKVKFTEQESKFYFCEVASALHYLHDTMQLVYRDIKPENILIDHSGHVKICDFGFTAPCNDDGNDLRDGCGTAMYIAPEIASGYMKGAHGFPVDWWALGCVLYEMISGEAPFGDSDSLSKFEIFNNITEKSVLYPLRMSQNVKQLLKGLLDKKPNTRFNWQKVSTSAWLQDVDWAAVESKKLKPPWIPETSPKVNHTSHFLKWDIALPTTAPAQTVQSYCASLRLPTRHTRPSILAGQRSSSSALPASLSSSTKSGPERGNSSAAMLKPDKSSSVLLRHQPSSSLMHGSDRQESSAKMLVNSPPTIKRKKSTLTTIGDSTADLNDSVQSSEKLKHRSPSRLQRGESQAGASALQRGPSRLNSSAQIHPH